MSLPTLSRQEKHRAAVLALESLQRQNITVAQLDPKETSYSLENERRCAPLELPRYAMGAVLTGLAPVSDEDLERVSRENPGWSFERDDAGALVVSPTSTDGGAKSGEAFGQLREWARSGPGGKVYDSSTGFKMPSGAVLSPDAAWISPDRAASLSTLSKQRYREVVPDVVVEVASETDSWNDVTAKIDAFIRHGAIYAVAINPYARTFYEVGSPPHGLAIDFDAIMDA